MPTENSSPSDRANSARLCVLDWSPWVVLGVSDDPLFHLFTPVLALQQQLQQFGYGDVMEKALAELAARAAPPPDPAPPTPPPPDSQQAAAAAAAVAAAVAAAAAAGVKADVKLEL